MTFVNALLTCGFAQGKVNYADQYGSSTRSWIVVPVTFGSRVLTPAIVDTGGLWCVLDPEDAEGLDFDYESGTEVEKPIAILGGSYTGWINTITVSIEADEGKSLTLESEVFIPERLGARRLPNVLGWYGFLMKLRFAIDPEHNHFYFAALGDNDF